LAGLFLILVIAGAFYRQSRQKQKANRILQNAYTKLQTTQTQLIHAEKMASLGELTAGIAHEIQNPLNFVNNFSEVSGELIDEMKEELAESSRQLAVGSRQLVEEKLKLVDEISDDLKQNLVKINHHGQRASSIVKGMLEHSRSGDGKKELTDINLLADEYLRLAYHGLRAKDKSFNADFKIELGDNLPLVKVIPQDIGRVLLNLINNAFYAVHQKTLTGFQTLSGLDKQGTDKPLVSITTKNLGDSIEISVKDNGNGIPSNIKEKIFQPFFTTKPTGEGTGLGLSMSYDIITKGHGGTLKVGIQEGKGLPAGQAGTEFIIRIPINPNE
jgi:signal transduction histidine kinase